MRSVWVTVVPERFAVLLLFFQKGFCDGGGACVGCGMGWFVTHSIHAKAFVVGCAAESTHAENKA